MDPDEKTRKKVLMLPWLAYGHISPFLELAKKLSKRNFYVYFCTTSINLSSIGKKLAAGDHDHDGQSIQLIEFQLTSQTDLLPHHHTTNGLPPHLLLDLIKAFDMSGPNFVNILNTVNPDLIIYDLFQSWLPALAASLQIPAVHFQIVGAVTTSAFYRSMADASIPIPSSSIFLHDNTDVRKTDERDYESSSGGNSGNVYLTNITVGSAKQSSDIILVKSIREIEEKYIEYLSLLLDKKIVPTGPLIQANVQIEGENDEIMEWLNKKDESSTVFVSFGSECYLSEPRIRELAHGLELSNVNFIWFIRFPGGEKMCNIEDVLPKGFIDRVKDRGMIVEGWAPQARILGHGGIRGFVSHCGWSSVMESMSFGVPIIAMPMQHDQPLHGRFVAEIGVGVEVMKDESGEFRRDEIAKAIKEVVVEKSGEGVKKAAMEMSERIKMRGEEDVDCVVEELTKLCNKYYHYKGAGERLARDVL